jgi:hypothetical protein
MEQLQQVYVIRLPPEMLLEEEIDGTFEHERVVDRNVADTGLHRGGRKIVRKVVNTKLLGESKT